MAGQTMIEIVLLYESRKTQRCSKCHATKDTAEFYRDKQVRNGLMRWCKECRKTASGRTYRARRAENKDFARLAHLSVRYGMSATEYDSMVAAQGGVCAICRRPSPSGRLAVDHDHATGKIRGLLCRPCNVSIGQVKEDTETLRRAIDYIESNR